MENNFDEKKHPRDKSGKFTDKDLQGMSTDELKKIASKPYDRKLESAVFEKISTCKRQLNKKGYAVITVFTWEKIYLVRLNKDYSYKVLEEKYNV